jgi:arylamine N-acetyltransferase
MRASTLSPRLVEQVLGRLGFSRHPEPDLEGLRCLYGAWCEKVPFDNLRKLIHVAAGEPTRLPGDDPADFLECWLTFGTGGTCWAASAALHALLASLGFRAARGVGTLLVAPNASPNHGTVIVAVEGARYLVDASMLHGRPLRLDDHVATEVTHAAWGVRCERREGRWHVRWRPLHIPNDVRCSVYRIDELDGSAERFSQLHERTRAWSPFNYEVYARSNRGDSVIGFARGRRVALDAAGRLVQSQPRRRERSRFLIEELKISERIVSLLPPDRPTPPPPGSRKARAAAREIHAPL